MSRHLALPGGHFPLFLFLFTLEDTGININSPPPPRWEPFSLSLPQRHGTGRILNARDKLFVFTGGVGDRGCVQSTTKSGTQTSITCEALSGWGTLMERCVCGGGVA